MTVTPIGILKVKVGRTTETLLEMNVRVVINILVDLVMIEGDARKFMILATVVPVPLMNTMTVTVETDLGHLTEMYLLSIIIINSTIMQDTIVTRISTVHAHVHHQDGRGETEAEADQVAKELQGK